MSSKVKEWTVLSMLEWATDFFKEHNIPDPRHSIEWLLAEILQVKRLDLYLKYDRPLSPDELNKLRPLVKRRASHEPLQYIIGYDDFVNAHILVDERVLIPRIETEQLVEIIIDQHRDNKALSVIDVGTGSGCIAVALKMECPQWNVHGIDISEDALEMAHKNAEENKVDVSFSNKDILAPSSINFEAPADIIVANPPYINPAEKETLKPQVVNYEPHQALFSDDMEKMYGSIISLAEGNLNSGGQLYLEIHHQYPSQITGFFDHSRWDTEILQDYDDKPRFIIAELVESLSS